MINGENDFENCGFTDGYEADYISVQCVGGEFRRKSEKNPISVFQRKLGEKR